MRDGGSIVALWVVVVLGVGLGCWVAFWMVGMRVVKVVREVLMLDGCCGMMRCD